MKTNPQKRKVAIEWAETYLKGYREGKASMKADVLKEIDKIEMGDWDCHQPCGCANENTKICKLCGNNMEKSSDNKRLEELKQSIRQLNNPQTKPYSKMEDASSLPPKKVLSFSDGKVRNSLNGDKGMDKPVDAQSEQDELVMKGTPAFRKGCLDCTMNKHTRFHCSSCTRESKPLGCGKVVAYNPKIYCGERFIGTLHLCPSCQKQERKQ